MCVLLLGGFVNKLLITPTSKWVVTKEISEARKKPPLPPFTKKVKESKKNLFQRTNETLHLQNWELT